MNLVENIEKCEREIYIYSLLLKYVQFHGYSFYNSFKLKNFFIKNNHKKIKAFKIYWFNTFKGTL